MSYSAAKLNFTACNSGFDNIKQTFELMTNPYLYSLCSPRCIHCEIFDNLVTRSEEYSH